LSDYGYTVEVPEGYDEAVLRARLALKGEGFSIITEMHVGGLIAPEAGTGRQYLIMGAWSPVTVQKEIDSELKADVHLPCNVVVQETGDSALVAVLDPGDDLSETPLAEEMAGQARGALERVLSKISEPV
jgi:uncharacterized protein (DUF302 family)